VRPTRWIKSIGFFQDSARTRARDGSNPHLETTSDHIGDHRTDHFDGKLITRVAKRSDRVRRLPRETLCELGEVERARHRRWLDAELLTERDDYGERDLTVAVALNALWGPLGRTEAKRAWFQVRDELGVPGRYLEVIYDFGAHAATLVREPSAIVGALPRDARIAVVDIASPVSRAMDRLRRFRATEELVEASTDKAAGRRGAEKGPVASASIEPESG
jgi:hypothetical protein